VAATRQGDVAAAQQSYTALLARKQTAFLGLRGLLGQALRAGDDDAARRLAERASQLRPDADWLLESLLVLEARAGDWAAARATLAGAAQRQTQPAERVRHHQAIILHELSRAAERSGELRRAAGLAARAQALAADLAEPAAHHARLLIALGRRRAAAKAIERAWRTAPHPDLARLYLDIRPAAPPLACAASLQRLARQNPEAEESRLAIADAALAAQLWGEARRHLGLAVAAAANAGSPGGPSRRLCLLMARLEESEPGDPAAARDWRDRAIGAAPDPCYVCSQSALAGAVHGLRRLRHARLAPPVNRPAADPRRAGRATGGRRRAADAAGAEQLGATAAMG
jgi:HemY protein